MRTLRQFIDGREKRLAFVTPDQTVLRALEIMAEADVGALLVLDGRNLLGVFSERDYARKVILQGKASRNTAVSEVMSDKVYSVTTEQSIEDCMAIMTDKHVRHLPVVDKTGNVLGIVSIGDVVKEIVTEQKFIISQLENYITG